MKHDRKIKEEKKRRGRKGWKFILGMRDFGLLVLMSTSFIFFTLDSLVEILDEDEREQRR